MRQKGFESEKTWNKGLKWQRESYEKTFRILGNKLARLQEEVAKQKHRLAELTKAGNAAETALRKVREELRLLRVKKSEEKKLFLGL